MDHPHVAHQEQAPARRPDNPPDALDPDGAPGGRTDLRGFVLTTNGRTPISSFSKAKEALDEAIDGLAGPGVVPGWVYHDLRRTLSTGCGELCIRIEYAEAVLNHVSNSKGGVAGTYNLYQ